MKAPPEQIEFNLSPDLWVPAKVQLKGAKRARQSKEFLKIEAEVKCFVDCGATVNCVHPDLVKQLGIPTKKHGRSTVSGVNNTKTMDVEYVTLYITHNGKGAWHPFRVIPCPRSQILLGMPWLHRTDSTIQFRDLSIKQGKKGITEPLATSKDTTTISAIRHQLAQHNRQIRQITKGKPMPRKELERRICSNLVRIHNLITKAAKANNRAEVSRLRARAINYEAPTIFAVWEKIPDADTKEAMAAFKNTPFESLVFEFVDVMRENQPEVPIRDQEDQMDIETDESKERDCWARPIRLDPVKTLALEKWLTESLEAGIIERSTSHMASPVFLVPKPNNKWRIVVDLRRVNAISKPMRNPVPRKEEILDRFRGKYYLSRADLIGAFFQVPLTKAAREKCAFVTPNGLYQFTVLPMGHRNSPAFFNDFVSRKFQGLEEFCSIYFDDLFIYSDNLGDHLKHLRKVFEILRKHKLYIKPSKLLLGQSEIPALGDIVSGTSARPDPAKTEGIKNYAKPSTKKQLRGFLGLCSYLRRYIPNYSHIAAPISSLMATTPERSKVIWTADATTSFEKLKTIMADPTTLAMADDSQYKILETDASDYAVGWTLKQSIRNPGVGSRSGEGEPDKQDELYRRDQDEVVAYGGRKLDRHERNLSTREKEFLGVLTGLRQNKVYLHKPFLIRTDHKSLTTVTKQKTISQKIARWYTELAEYDFRIDYLPGEENTVADALSRQPQDEGTDTREEIRQGLEELFKASIYSTTHPLMKKLQSIPSNQDFLNQMRRAQKRAGIGAPYHEREGLWYDNSGHRSRLILPHSKKLFQRIYDASHNDPYGGHYGFRKTIRKIGEVVVATKELQQFVKKKIGICRTCQVARGNRIAHRMRGTSTPDAPWKIVAADFIDGLPTEVLKLTGHTITADRILVVICLLTRKAMFIPALAKWTSEDVIRQMHMYLFRHVGYPTEIHADNDRLWIEGTETYETLGSLGIRVRQLPAYSSKTNGVCERVHQSIHNYMRAYLKDKTRWIEALPLAEICYNSTPHKSIGDITPFQAERGYPMRLSKSIIPAFTKRPSNHKFIEERTEELGRLQCLSDQQKGKYLKGVQGNRPPFETKKGSWVMLSTEKFSKDQLRLPKKVTNKWGPKWAGPFQIIEVISEGRTVRLNLGDTRKRNIVSTDDLKTYTGEPPKTGSGPSIGHSSSVNISAAAAIHNTDTSHDTFEG